MARKKKVVDSPAATRGVPAGPVQGVGDAATRTKGSHLRVISKDFDLRAAHQAWKERNGIESDYGW